MAAPKTGPKRPAKKPAKKKAPLDRTALLAKADKARAVGRRKRAILLYAKLIEQDPKDLAVHAKIAPLLAAEGLREPAMASFRAAADGQAAAGFVDRGIALLRQAAGLFPDEESLWVEVAAFHVQRGRRADAVAVLTEGGRRLLPTRYRAVGAKLLRRALEIEPWNVRAALLLAKTLAKERRKEEAIALLEGLAQRIGGMGRRNARGLAFRLSPTPARLARWILGR